MKELEKLYAKIEELTNVTEAEAHAKLERFQPELMEMTLRYSAENNFTLTAGLR